MNGRDDQLMPDVLNASAGSREGATLGSGISANLDPQSFGAGAKEMEWSNAKKAFHGLVWPAVGGNVAWSVISLAVYPPAMPDQLGITVGARLTTLSLLALYLVGDWLRTYDEPGSFRYWLFDGLHLIALAFLAIGAAQPKSLDWLSCWLIALLGITAAGHILKAFGIKGNWRFTYMAANLLGIPIVLWLQLPNGYQLAAAVLAVLFVWAVFRYFEPANAKV